MPLCTTREPTRKRYRKVALCEAATMGESMVLPGGAVNFGDVRRIRGTFELRTITTNEVLNDQCVLGRTRARDLIVGYPEKRAR